MPDNEIRIIINQEEDDLENECQSLLSFSSQKQKNGEVELRGFVFNDDNLLRKIFSYFNDDLSSIHNLCQVSKKWHHFSHHFFTVPEKHGLCLTKKFTAVLSDAILNKFNAGFIRVIKDEAESSVDELFYLKKNNSSNSYSIEAINSDFIADFDHLIGRREEDKLNVVKLLPYAISKKIETTIQLSIAKKPYGQKISLLMDRKALKESTWLKNNNIEVKSNPGRVYLLQQLIILAVFSISIFLPLKVKMDAGNKADKNHALSGQIFFGGFSAFLSVLNVTWYFISAEINFKKARLKYIDNLIEKNFYVENESSFISPRSPTL